MKLQNKTLAGQKLATSHGLIVVGDDGIFDTEIADLIATLRAVGFKPLFTRKPTEKADDDTPTIVLGDGPVSAPDLVVKEGEEEAPAVEAVVEAVVETPVVEAVVEDETSVEKPKHQYGRHEKKRR